MQYALDGNTLVLRIDLNTKGALSKEGKSHVIDSTRGFVAFASHFGTCKIGLNVITTDAEWTGGGLAAKDKPQPQLVKTA